LGAGPGGGAEGLPTAQELAALGGLLQRLLAASAPDLPPAPTEAGRMACCFALHAAQLHCAWASLKVGGTAVPAALSAARAAAIAARLRANGLLALLVPCPSVDAFTFSSAVGMLTHDKNRGALYHGLGLLPNAAADVLTAAALAAVPGGALAFSNALGAHLPPPAAQAGALPAVPVGVRYKPGEHGPAISVAGANVPKNEPRYNGLLVLGIIWALGVVCRAAESA
jgi:hypothetical protein